jgi:Cu(I)/Ag(I) efflux system membrane protein CusA/SilA
MNFRSFAEVAIIIGTLPLALIGGVWLLYLEDFNLSVASGVGFIALAGVAAEIGVIMLVYLNQSYAELMQTHQDNQTTPTQEELVETVMQGAGLRVRPVIMTGATIMLGLLPVLYGTGTGSEVMSRIAAPMVGGMASALVLSLVIVPVVYLLWRKQAIK